MIQIGNMSPNEKILLCVDAEDLGFIEVAMSHFIKHVTSHKLVDISKNISAILEANKRDHLMQEYYENMLSEVTK